VPAAGKCSDGIGLSTGDGRCWYLSETGASCDATCRARGFSFSFVIPSEDMTPKLVNHEPAERLKPWALVECYVPHEDRYHPANPHSGSKVTEQERIEAGEYNYDICRLACPCAGASLPPAPPVPAPTYAPMPMPPSGPYDGTCSGMIMSRRCWYMSEVGESCDQTCASHGYGCQFNFVMTPLNQDMTPLLIGHEPHSKLAPWRHVECYVPEEDRYHPVNHDTPDAELAQGGDYSYETCKLACPCSGTCLADWTPTAAPTPPPPWNGQVIYNGLQAHGRLWYLSETGGNCRDTCAVQGLTFSWASPPEGDPITPRILGHEPPVRQSPWTFVETYVRGEDRYHTINRNSWKEMGAEQRRKAATWSHSDASLSCPCVAASQAGCRWEQPPACSPEFEWKGVLYTGCPTVDHDKPWCQHHHHHIPIAADDPNAGIVDWSDCDYVCDSEPEKVPPSSNCGWKPAATCAPEFDYEGTLIIGCSSSDYHTPWCSNSAVYSGSWTHCQYQCDNPSAADLKTMADLNKWAEDETELCSWQPSPKCSLKFLYKDTEYEGCALWVDHPTPWCSHDRIHRGNWSACERLCKTISG